MKIVLPIAGLGTRFKKVAHLNPAYKVPKPLIEIKGFPMVRWATGSLPFVEHPGQKVKGGLVVKPKDLIFIALQAHQIHFKIRDKLEQVYGKGLKVVFINTVTRGAAETVLKARDFIDNEEQLIVSDSDHFLDGQALQEGIRKYPEADGLIPVFRVPEKNPKWSYSRLNDGGFVDLVAEKIPISEWANIGAYYFKKGKDFVQGAEEMVRQNELTNNEFYVAPVYNKLIEKGKKIRLVYPKYVYGLGTPEDLEFFVKKTDFTL